MIIEIDSKFFVVSKDGIKNLGGPYDSREEAQKRLRQVEHFKHKENLVFEVQNFSLEVEEKEGKISGARLFGTALAEGISRNKRNYTIDNLKENNGEMFNFIVAHRKDYDNPDHNVGEGIYTFNGNKLDFDGKIKNTHHHPDIVEQVKDGLVAPSVQGGYTDVKAKDGKIVFEGLRIPILALVNKHVRGVEAASIEAVISEKLELDDVSEGDKMSEDFVKLLKEKEDKLKEMTDDLTKVKEALHGKEEEMKVMMKKEEDAKAEKKKKVVESITSLNKDIKVDDIKDKSLSELELMESYEKKLKENKESEDLGFSEVDDSEKGKIDDGIVIERDGNITMSESARRKFNDEIMKSIYR